MRAPRLLYIMTALILFISTGCCSHVDHKKLATFPTLRKSYEGIKTNLESFKITDEQSNELRDLTIEECEEGIKLCLQAEKGGE